MQHVTLSAEAKERSLAYSAQLQWRKSLMNLPNGWQYFELSLLTFPINVSPIKPTINLSKCTMCFIMLYRATTKGDPTFI